jgi:WD40 repeat protein
VRLWDVQTGTLHRTLEGHSGDVNAVTFSPNGELIASASNDQIVRLWDAHTGALRSTLEGHSRWVNAVTFSPNGELIASASYDQKVRLWDAQTGTLCSTLEGQGYISYLSFNTNGSYLKTNKGCIDLKIPDHGTIPETDYSSSYSLSEDNCWVVWKGYNILWLPPEYRPACSRFQEDILVMGHSSGQVTFTRFQPCTHISELC